MESQQTSIGKIKEEVQNWQGKRVRLEAHKSKKKLYHKEGVVEGIYPSIFTVSVQEGRKPKQRLSFSYSDVLTRSVKIALVDDIQAAVLDQ